MSDCRFDREWLARLLLEVASKRCPDCSVKAACIDPRGNDFDRSSRMALYSCRALFAAAGSREANTLPTWHTFTNMQVLNRRIEIAETADC
jgi:hypothetical protein